MDHTLDIDHLRQLIDLVADENIAELAVQDGGLSIRIERDPGSAQALSPAAAPATVPTAPEPSGTRPPAEPVAAPVASATRADTTADAPMTGTFYRAAQAGGTPLVDVGTVVEPGTPLCVIEAMKILNEIVAERAGTVTRVLVENGQMVEPGQPLFVIS